MKHFLTSLRQFLLGKKHRILVLILILSTFLHLFRLDFPNAYVFDEVYHGFTAKEYLKGNIEAWEWWTTPPPGVAYEWTHPPLAKEIMTVSMFLVGSTDPWAWRLPGALLGIFCTYLMYLLGKKLFDNELIANLSAFLFSIEGLILVQSRTGMNDIYVVTGILLTVLMLLRKKYFWASVFVGLALSSKWTGLYLIGISVIYLFFTKAWKKSYLFILVPLVIYLICYIPFFWQEHTLSQFIDFNSLFKCQLIKLENPCPYTYGLQNQMLSYHTNLVATHDYSSKAWTWPLNLYPVWYYVQYFPSGYTANIFASGNPLLFWFGFGSVFVVVWDYFKTRNKALFIILLGFFGFWLPWFTSPRIMFLYHFSPSVPFLCLALAYQLAELYHQPKQRPIFYLILGLTIASFIFVYPMLTGIPLPKNLMLSFFDINLTKNPFK
jgi:dolichyl-phosphate-mannose--protein O-mannosyl transferase